MTAQAVIGYIIDSDIYLLLLKAPFTYYSHKLIKNFNPVSPSTNDLAQNLFIITYITTVLAFHCNFKCVLLVLKTTYLIILNF